MMTTVKFIIICNKQRRHRSHDTVSRDVIAQITVQRNVDTISAEESELAAYEQKHRGIIGHQALQ